MRTPSRSRGRPPLPLERIIAAALEILDEQGADALSMRTLAQRLDSGTATLYRHFEGRADLLARVIDSVIGEIDTDILDLLALPWQQACEALANSMFDVLRRHPHVARIMIDQIPVGPNMLALRERALAVLLKSGFPPPLALRAWATVARYVLGFGNQFDSEGGQHPLLAWATVDPALFPASIVVAAHGAVSLEDEFTFGLELLITGLERQVCSD